LASRPLAQVQPHDNLATLPKCSIWLNMWSPITCRVCNFLLDDFTICQWKEHPSFDHHLTQQRSPNHQSRSL
jgi:hypothetical protein